MQEIQYDIDQDLVAPKQAPPAPKFDLIESLVRSGIVQSRETAQYFLIAVVVIASIVSFLLLYGGSRGAQADPLHITSHPGEQIPQ